MKYLLSLFVVAIVTIAFAEVPTFGQYSNIRDSQFRILNGVTTFSNYWDTARNAYVYFASVISKNQGENGGVVTTKEWVEKDNKVVESTIAVVFLPSKGNEYAIMESALDYTLKFVNTFDGCQVIASTPNVSYRGDSAERVKEILFNWCKNTKGLPHKIGFEWRCSGVYAFTHLCVDKIFGGTVIACTSRLSDNYIELKGSHAPPNSLPNNTVDEYGLNATTYHSGMDYAYAYVRIKMGKEFQHAGKSETKMQWVARAVMCAEELCFRDRVWHKRKGLPFFDNHEKHMRAAKQLVNEIEGRDKDWEYK